MRSFDPENTVAEHRLVLTAKPPRSEGSTPSPDTNAPTDRPPDPTEDRADSPREEPRRTQEDGA